MNKPINPKAAIQLRLAKIVLMAALALTTLAPFMVSAAADQTQSMQETATPTPTPEPIKPPAEQMVSWNT